jgi:argininosuccinate lyase
MLAVLRTPTARTDHFLSTAGDLHRTLRAVTGAVRLLAGVLSTLHVDRDALAATAADPGLVLADLADQLVARGLGDRRGVHQLLGRAARQAAQAGRPLTPDDLRAALGADGIEVPGQLLALLDDPTALLTGRAVTGGWGRLPELLSASTRELGRRRRAGTALLSAVDGAEAALVTEARARGGSA